MWSATVGVTAATHVVPPVSMASGVDPFHIRDRVRL